MAKELTAIAIERIKPGPVRREIPDGRMAGLYFIVQPSGKQSWAFRYRYNGKSRKLTLGPFPALSIAEARKRAVEAAVAVADGGDPGAEKVTARRAGEIPPNDLLEHVAQQFIRHYAKRHLRPRTVQELERLLEKEIVGPWGGRRLSEIGKSDIHELLDGIVERGSPVVANRTLSWFRRLCSWAVERGILTANPCTSIKAPAAETARDRVLSDDEIAAVWRAACELEQPYDAFIKLLLLTGARRGEIAGMRWQEIDLTKKIWVLPKERAKNGRELSLPLPDTIADILSGTRRGDGPADFVFTINGRNPIANFHKIKNQFDDRLPEDMPPWTFHDLRRSFASGCARLGVAVHVVEAALNHGSGSIKGVAAVYNRYSYSTEMRHALELWSRHVASIVSGEPAENVVELSRSVVRN